MKTIKIIFLTILICCCSYAEYSIEDLVKMSTINLLWLNKEKPAEDGTVSYVFPEPYLRQVSNIKEDIEKINTFERLSLWAKLNPNTKLRIWYDATTVADDAKENTLLKFADLGVVRQIELVDINESLAANKLLFNKELPIYFRVDILRIIATFSILKKALEAAQTEFFVYVDFSVEPLKLKKLYKGDGAVDNINNFGIIVGKTDGESYENSMHVIGNNYPNLLSAIEGVFINKNIIRVKHSNKSLSTIDEQIVYEDYADLMPLFFALQDLGKIATNYPHPNNMRHTHFPNIKKEMSIEEIKSAIQINKLDISYNPLRPAGKIPPLFKEDGRGFNTYYTFQPGDLLNNLDAQKESYWLPTRSGISKTSKFSF